MTDRDFKEAIEVAAEYAERFPDMTDNDVHDHVMFVTGAIYHEDSAMARKVIAAYDAAAAKVVGAR